MKKRTRITSIRERLMLETGTALLPNRCIFYLTSGCNLNCKMCFQQSHKRHANELSLEEIQDIFQDVSLSSILLVGGEIFTRPDVYDIISFFDSRVEHISIQTNATLIDQNGIERLRAMKHVSDLWISIDGLNEVHNAIRGNTTFENAVNVVNALKDVKRIFINTVILKENIHQLCDIYTFFNDLGVYQITFQFEMGYNVEQYRQAKAAMQKQELDLVIVPPQNATCDFSYACDLLKIIPELMQQKKNTRLCFYPEIFVDRIDSYVSGNIRNVCKVICNDLLESVLKIDSEGNVVLCEAFNLSIGNLKSDLLEEIWNGVQARKIRRSLAQMNLVDLCSRCCCLAVSEGYES